MADKGTLTIAFFHPTFNAMSVTIDYECIRDDDIILLTNPKVWIPSLSVSAGDPREHHQWKEVLYGEVFRADVERQLLQNIGVEYLTMEINFKELM